MKTNPEIRHDSLLKLRGNWLICILACLVFTFILGALNAPSSVYRAIMMSESYSLSAGSGILAILIGAPLSIGLTNAFRLFWQRDDTDLISNMFNFGFRNYLHVVAGNLLYAVLLVLWTLLLIVPGIIKSMAYFCVPYLLVEEPELTPMDAIRKSEQMMKGHKMDLFKMVLGFYGWFLLCLLTLGIGLIWWFPYVFNTQAKFYIELSDSQK